ncbi:uncharacterized protein F4822DRAFT_153027 [Hypoxylon trugodes]|uniref:uncharacterized protein n=1 Tax=Hypoxylon trugodes TaxID=326681 RepID=UPI00218E1F4E|nr:uncharacterized protein F4822DRAFT_153027 [Hypoxylon trugodes]KAI1390523.1 hypothetical protein F4822DRAFT_153027 [Hypoxylon trugodes]
MYNPDSEPKHVDDSSSSDFVLISEFINQERTQSLALTQANNTLGTVDMKNMEDWDMVNGPKPVESIHEDDEKSDPTTSKLYAKTRREAEGPLPDSTNGRRNSGRRGNALPRFVDSMPQSQGGEFPITIKCGRKSSFPVNFPPGSNLAFQRSEIYQINRKLEKLESLTTHQTKILDRLVQVENALLELDILRSRISTVETDTEKLRVRALEFERQLNNLRRNAKSIRKRSVETSERDRDLIGHISDTVTDLQVQIDELDEDFEGFWGDLDEIVTRLKRDLVIEVPSS